MYISQHTIASVNPVDIEPGSIMKFFIVLALCCLSSSHALFYGGKGGGGAKGGSAGSMPPSPGSQFAYLSPSPGLYPVSAPIYSSRQVEYVPLPGQGYLPQPQLITVEPHAQPVQFLFKSQSSPLQLRQVHLPSPQGHYQVTRSQELPQVIRHETYKPVVSELVETVVPYRNIVQVVKPVRENVLTVVPKAQPYPGVRYYSPPGPMKHVVNSFIHKFATKGKPEPEPEPEQQQQQEEEDEQQQEEQQPSPSPPPVKGRY